MGGGSAFNSEAIYRRAPITPALHPRYLLMTFPSSKRSSTPTPDGHGGRMLSELTLNDPSHLQLPGYFFAGTKLAGPIVKPVDGTFVAVSVPALHWSVELCISRTRVVRDPQPAASRSVYPWIPRHSTVACLWRRRDVVAAVQIHDLPC